MNRFKKTMALTAACVIAATAVNVGGVGVNSPKVTFGNIVAAAAGETEANAISDPTQQGGAPKTQDSKSVTLTFTKDPGTIEREHISIVGADLSSDKDAISGEGTSRTFKISNITVLDSENITIKIKQVGKYTFADTEVLVYRALPLTEVVAKSAVVKEGAERVILVTLEGRTVHTVPSESKDEFKVEGKTVQSVEKSEGAIKITVTEDVKANEVLTVSYDPTTEAVFANRVKVDNENTVAGKFSVKVTNEVDPEEKPEVAKIEVLDGVKDVQASSKIKVTFKEALDRLSEKDFALSAAKVVKAETKDGGKSYILDINDISSANQILSCKKVDYGFIGDALSFKVHVKTGNGNGASGQTSVRPGSSAPSAKEEVKKEEPKKEEAKKDEAKKDEMPAMATTSDKVSTKLVIGQKTYTATVNGQSVEKTMDVAPMVHMGRTVLPARMISELLGVDVKFDQASKTASFMYGEGNKVELTLGQKFMMVNGEKVALTADILNKDGRILLPVTDIQKAFAKLGLQATVTWDAATKSVMIEK